MSEATNTRDDASLGVAKRTHPLTALVNSGLFAIAGLVMAFRSIIEGDTSKPFGREALIAAAGLGIGLIIGLAVGYVRWRFTFYRISSDELRIDTGPIVRRSRKVALDRIQSVDIAQPFLARILGLSALRVESAGGADSVTVVKYLSAAEALETRQLLLDLAASDGAPVSAPGPDQERSVIAAVPFLSLLLGALLSSEFLVAVVILAGSIIGLVTHAPWLAWGALPVLLWMVGVLSSRVFAQWGFTLSRTSHGMRIERGLFSTSSQTIPLDRVQGIVASSPGLWQLFGWRRLEVDIAGYGKAASEDGVSDTTLLPIGRPELARHITEALIEGTDPELAIDRVRPPARTALLEPIGWRFRWSGHTDSALLVRSGWLVARLQTIRHHKAQSISVTQGPVDRLLGVASIHIDLPAGPVTGSVRRLDADTAHRFAEAQGQRSFGADTKTARSATARRVFGTSEQSGEVGPRVEPPLGKADPTR